MNNKNQAIKDLIESIHNDTFQLDQAEQEYTSTTQKARGWYEAKLKYSKQRDIKLRELSALLTGGDA